MAEAGGSGGRKRTTVQRAVAVLRALGRAPRPLGVTAVAEALDLPKASVFRLLQDLVDAGCAQRDRGTRRYRLAPGLVELGERARRQIDLADVARPILEDVARRVNETVNFGILHGPAVLIVDSVKYVNGPRLSVDLGPVSEVHCSALGKALLSCLPRDEREQMLAEIELTPRTDNTITSRQKLRREVDQVLRTGVAYDREEYEVGLYCVAVPIPAAARGTPGAISVSGPVSRLRADRSEEIIRCLREAADRLASLGPGAGASGDNLREE